MSRRRHISDSENAVSGCAASRFSTATVRSTAGAGRAMVLSPRLPSDISVLSVTSVIGALAHRGELRDAIAERPRQDPMPFIARVDTVGKMLGAQDSAAGHQMQVPVTALDTAQDHVLDRLPEIRQRRAQ